MLSIRLSRVGRKNDPQFRVIIIEKRRDPWAKHLEILGHYHPRAKERGLTLKEDRIKYWLSQGAEASDTMWNILVDAKLVEGKKRTVTRISKQRATKIKEKTAAAAPKEEPKPPEETK